MASQRGSVASQRGQRREQRGGAAINRSMVLIDQPYTLGVARLHEAVRSYEVALAFPSCCVLVCSTFDFTFSVTTPVNFFAVTFGGRISSWFESVRMLGLPAC